MYYQKDKKHLNNDYYNAYVEQSTRGRDTSDILTTIIKILAIVFLLTLIIFGYVFVSNQYYLSKIQAQEMQSLKIQEKQPQVLIGVNSIESVTKAVDKEKKNLSSEDVTQIVRMVMLKMNSLKKEESMGKKNITKNNHKDDRVVIKERKKHPSQKNNIKIIVVEEGDTLSTIANRAYGNENAYKKIYAANPEIIKDKDKIFIGQKIRIPQ